MEAVSTAARTQTQAPCVAATRSTPYMRMAGHALVSRYCNCHTAPAGTLCGSPILEETEGRQEEESPTRPMGMAGIPRAASVRICPGSLSTMGQSSLGLGLPSGVSACPHPQHGIDCLQQCTSAWGHRLSLKHKYFLV